MRFGRLRPQATAGYRIFVLQQFSERPARHHVPAMDARAGAEVNDVVRAPHGFFVMLHHDQRIAALL